MKNTTCIICSNEFTKPRAGKLYCSAACKQQGYLKSIEQLSSLQEQEVKKTEAKYLVHHHEFMEFKKTYPNTILDEFTMYVFFRKQLTGIVTPDKFVDYLADFGSQYWEDFKGVDENNYYTHRTSPEREKYNEFKEGFDDNVIISLD